MSWGISAIGRSEAVKKAVAIQFFACRCEEPEETVRQAAKALIDAALDAQKPGTIVRVGASGSQSKTGEGVTNHLSLSVEPQWGFVE